MIRKARKEDIRRIIELLHQVNMVHHVIRPDLFKPHTTKYNELELEAMLDDDSKPIFVYDDDAQPSSGTLCSQRMVLGYAFCQVSEVKDNQLLEDIKTLYIDDICVDEIARGKHVGKALYEYVRDYAKAIGCNNITLNVWEGNEPAQRFYRSMGMQVQKTTMEIILK
jgi:ribosomal protein S18 acetylase RimI-like enzyme